MNIFTNRFSTGCAVVVAGLLFTCAPRVPAEGISLPVIPSATFNVTNYGAVGDGKTLNTAALQKAIDAASTAGGGTVLVPAGKFLTGPFTLASSINLHLAKNAAILVSDDHGTLSDGQGTVCGQHHRQWRARPGNQRRRNH
jgi:polygalacturonase